MKQNMSWADRIIRFVLGSLLTILFFTGGVTGALGTVLIILAGIMIVTAIAGVCPLYTFLHIDSRTTKQP